MIKDWQNGTHKWKAWSMAHEKVVDIEPMTFAREQNSTILGEPAGKGPSAYNGKQVAANEPPRSRRRPRARHCARPAWPK